MAYCNVIWAKAKRYNLWPGGPDHRPLWPRIAAARGAARYREPPSSIHFRIQVVDLLTYKFVQQLRQSNLHGREAVGRNSVCNKRSTSTWSGLETALLKLRCCVYFIWYVSQQRILFSPMMTNSRQGAKLEHPLETAYIAADFSSADWNDRPDGVHPYAFVDELTELVFYVVIRMRDLRGSGQVFW